MIGAAGTWFGLNGQVVWRLACRASTSETDLTSGKPATHGNAMALGTIIMARRRRVDILAKRVVEAGLKTSTS